MKILILGSNGFLGKNFLKHPLSKEHVILNPSKNNLNLLDVKLIDDYLSYHNPDLIINCAGIVGGIAANINNDLNFLNENISINKNLILSSFQHNIKKFINFGSSCMYPSHLKGPMEESQITGGNFEKTNEGFALSKVVSLKLCEYISNDYNDFFYKTIIPCNLFGSFDHYNDKIRSHMIASAINKVHEAKLNNSDTIIVWGSGKVRREYTSAYNVVDFVYKNIQNISSFPNYFNLGINLDYSVKQYYEMIMKLFNFEANLKMDISKPDGVFQKLLNTTYPQKINWINPLSLRDGLKEAINFYMINHAK